MNDLKIKPKVSIIVPVYNVEKFLQKCLDSIVEQTLKEIEIICINDGSPDNSLEILNEYASKDDRIIVISQENQGLSAARNAGLKIATGEYIGFVDSDDYIELNYYEKLYNTACKNDSDIALTTILKHKKKYLRYNVLHKKEKVAYTLNDKMKISEDNTHRIFYVWNKIYRKTLLDKYQMSFPVGRVFEDVLFNLKTIYYANSIVSVPNTKYHYVENSFSILKSKNNSEKKKHDHIAAYTELQEFAKENNIVLPERLNYIESFWENNFIKVYKGLYKSKKMLFGCIKLKEF